jgi:hypothetical protein
MHFIIYPHVINANLKFFYWINLILLMDNFFSWYNERGGVQLGPLGTAATNRPILPAPGDYDDIEIGRVTGRGN